MNEIKLLKKIYHPDMEFGDNDIFIRIGKREMVYFSPKYTYEQKVKLFNLLRSFYDVGGTFECTKKMSRIRKQFEGKEDLAVFLSGKFKGQKISECYDLSYLLFCERELSGKGYAKWDIIMDSIIEQIQFLYEN